jgi:DNA-binding XRE family transcriptional regulator
LLADAQTPPDLWNVAPPAIPPRSCLHSLEPVGVGTAGVECLTGYVARLAESHKVSVALLFGHVLAPLLRKEYLRRAALRFQYPCRILAGAFRPLARAMNGTGVGALEWVDLLQTLTLRDELRFLTLLTWKEVLPQRQLLRGTRAWCPSCFQEWRDRGAVVYEPLLWAVRAVTVCQRHGRSLRTICGRCGQPSHALASRSRPGHCPACGAWLGEPANVGCLDEGQVAGEAGRLLWAAGEVGELLAVAPKLERLPSRGDVLKSSSEHVREYLGSLPALSKLAGVNKTTLWQWSKGKYLPQLESLLKLCYCFEIPLLDFVTGQTGRQHSVVVMTATPAREEESIPPVRRRRPLDVAEAGRILQAALREEPPPTLRDVAARIGRDANTLRYRFGDLCKAVVERRAAYDQSCVAKRWEDVGRALRRVLEEGYSPSLARVALRLGHDVKTLSKHHRDLCRAISDRHSASRKVRWEWIRTVLQEALAEQPPPSVLTMAERLGLSKSSLYENLPSLCHQIARRYVSHHRRRPRAAAARNEG